jgi:hypothetical protein
VNLVAQVIKGQQPVEEHQFAIRQREIVLGMFANFFQLPDHVVRKIADRPGSERRQTGNQCRLVLAQQLLHDLKDVALPPLALPSAFNLDGRTPRPHPHVRPRTQERVTADLLAALDRLQQKRVRLFSAIARKAETGVSRSALTDFTTGTSVADAPAARIP